MKNWKNEKMNRCRCNFRQTHRRFPWFCFGMCLFPEENQQPVLGSHRFSEEKWQFSLDVKQKYTFSDENRRKKKSLRSAHLTTTTHQKNKLFNNNDNNTIWRGSVLSGEEPPPDSGELKHALSQAGGPTQSQLSRLMSSGHHISMEHRQRRKQLNSDTNASNKKDLKEMQEKRKRRNFFLRKNEKRKWKNIKNQKMKKWTKCEKMKK